MKKGLLATCVVAVSALGLAVVPSVPAGAAPIDSGSARGFGAQVQVAGNDALPPSAEASVTAPPFDDDAQDALVTVPADPITVTYAAEGEAKVHLSTDISSELGVVTQALSGKYNAQGLGAVTDAAVGVGLVGAGVDLVDVGLVRGEAVAACVNGTPQYSATSEIVDLSVADTDIPLNQPISDILDTIGDILGQTGLDQVVDLDRNVVTDLDGNAVDSATVSAVPLQVDALVLTVLSALGEPLVKVTLGHAETGAVTCAPNPGTIKKNGPDAVTAGDAFDYTITVTNVGTACDLTTVTVTDTITGPEGATVASTSPQADSVSGTTAAGGITIVWNDVGPIAPSASKTLTVKVQTASTMADGGVLTDHAHADYDCGDTRFPADDTIQKPRIDAPLGRTGIEAAAWLLPGGALLLLALAVGHLRRRATA